MKRFQKLIQSLRSYIQKKKIHLANINKYMMNHLIYEDVEMQYINQKQVKVIKKLINNYYICL